MREILFRIWNGTSYEYDVMVGKFGAFYVNPMNDGLDVDDSASLSPFNTKFSDDVVIEQFTGLTDKNGKKIFEGDIVRINHSLHVDLVVSFQDGCFCFGVFNGKSFGDFVSVRESMDQARRYFEEELVVEVIGNIHDNPELLP